jgi:hypothetical protein
MWWVKVVVLVLLLATVVSLFRALSAMMRGEGGEGKTVKALAWRIGLSIAIFLFLLLSMYMGWVKPHGVNPTKGYAEQASERASSGSARVRDRGDKVRIEERQGVSTTEGDAEK